MPGVFSPALIPRNFPGSSGGIFSICPGFYSRRQFSGNFRALAVRIFLYARGFAHAGNSREISGHWRREFLYMPEILLPPAIPEEFPGSGGEIFPICPGYINYDWFFTTLQYNKIATPQPWQAIAQQFCSTSLFNYKVRCKLKFSAPYKSEFT